MRRYWPFLIFAVAIAVHMGFLIVGETGVGTKLFLMPSLVASILIAAAFTGALPQWAPRGTRAVILLETVIALEWIADIVWDRYTPLAGMLASLLVQVSLIALFVAALRPRWRSWIVIPYALAFVAAVTIFASAFGDLAILAVGYALVLFGMAYIAARVSVMIGIGAILFVASAIVKAVVMFLPGFVGDAAPLVNAIVILLYCAGLGLIAVGTMRRLSRLAAERQPQRSQLVEESPWSRALRDAGLGTV